MADDKTAPLVEPITLKDLIQSLAASVVATSQHLDQASVDLRNLYLNSGNAGLAALVPPRYALDEVTVDLTLVVTSAAPDALVEKKKAPETDQNFQPTARPEPANIADKLSEQARQDALDLAATNSANLEKFINDLKTQLDIVNKQIPPAQQRVNALRKAMGGHPFQPAQVEQAQRELNFLNARSKSLSDQLDQASQKKQRLDETAKAAKAAKDTPLTPLQIENFRNIGIPIAPLANSWNNFYQKYQNLKGTYDDGVKAYLSDAGLPKIPDFGLTPDEQQLLDKIQARIEDSGWKTLAKDVKIIQADYSSTLNALSFLLQQVASAKGAGLKVRIDPAGLAAVPAEARQKLHLSFRGHHQQAVKVGGKDLDVMT